MSSGSGIIGITSRDVVKSAKQYAGEVETGGAGGKF